MRSAYFIVIICFILYPITLFGQTDEDYNMSFVNRINQQIDTISLSSTVVFLNSFQVKSDDNDFLRFRNETLFKLLERRPEMYLSGMCQISDSLKWAAILNEIESPSPDVAVETISTGPISIDKVDDCKEEVQFRTIICLDKASWERLMRKKGQ